MGYHHKFQVGTRVFNVHSNHVGGRVVEVGQEQPHVGGVLVRVATAHSWAPREFGVSWNWAIKAQPLHVAMCGGRIAAVDPRTGSDVRTWETRGRFLERAIAWAKDNGYELVNVWGGKVWL
jgi:hypothetical protein